MAKFRGNDEYQKEFIKVFNSISRKYDRWEMKMSKQGSALLKEWPDLLLFCNYKTIIVENDGKKKAKGAERVMYSAHHACWDAKTRYQLPEMMKLGIDPLKALFSAAPAKTTTEPAKTTETAKQAATTAASTAETAKTDESSSKAETIPESDELRKLRTLMEMSGISPEQKQTFKLEEETIQEPETPAFVLADTSPGPNVGFVIVRLRFAGRENINT